MEPRSSSSSSTSGTIRASSLLLYKKNRRRLSEDEEYLGEAGKKLGEKLKILTPILLENIKKLSPSQQRDLYRFFSKVLPMKHSVAISTEEDFRESFNEQESVASNNSTMKTPSALPSRF
jgi:hypothetical protein